MRNSSYQPQPSGEQRPGSLLMQWQERENAGIDLCALQYPEYNNFQQPAWKSSEKWWTHEDGELWRIASTGDKANRTRDSRRAQVQGSASVWNRYKALAQQEATEEKDITAVESCHTVKVSATIDSGAALNVMPVLGFKITPCV